jgi:hypothetical protein
MFYNRNSVFIPIYIQNQSIHIDVLIINRVYKIIILN